MLHRRTRIPGPHTLSRTVSPCPRLGECVLWTCFAQRLPADYRTVGDHFHPYLTRFGDFPARPRPRRGRRRGTPRARTHRPRARHGCPGSNCGPESIRARDRREMTVQKWYLHLLRICNCLSSANCDLHVLQTSTCPYIRENNSLLNNEYCRK